MVSFGERARLSLRIPVQIDEVLKQQAKRDGRSQNALINEILQAYVAENIPHCSNGNLNG